MASSLNASRDEARESSWLVLPAGGIDLGPPLQGWGLFWGAVSRGSADSTPG